MNEQMVNELVHKLTIEEMVGQTLCYDIYDKDDPDEVEKVIQEIRPGGIFVTDMSADKIKMYTEMVNKYVKVPVIVSADIEFGVGCALSSYKKLPHPMAWGACGDEKLIRRAGELTAALCRKNGIHWSFAPVVDINYNKNNPVVNIRSISESPDLVWRIAAAYSKGMQTNGYMAVGAKHFPGDGVDDRNQHYCTTVNSFSRHKWMKTYGKVYRKMISNGISSVMAAHICLPAFQKKESETPLPSVLSARLLQGLLREKLGFKGCIVSDAMSMIGACSRAKPEELAVKFLNAGGDMVLFPEKTDFKNILSAVKNGNLKKERLEDAVKHILLMKNFTRLFEDQDVIKAELQGSYEDEYNEVARLIAEKSIKIERNEGNLPFNINSVKKVLMLNLGEHQNLQDEKIFLPLEEELRKRGLYVESYWNKSHYEIKQCMNNFDMVLINAKFIPSDYSCGASLRIGWDNIMTFWRGYVLQHKNCVFVSFGDPYKLYELPFLKTYINCFSCSEFSQIALSKVLFGEISTTAKNPVSLPPFFYFGK